MASEDARADHGSLATGRRTRWIWGGVIAIVALALMATGVFWLSSRSSKSKVEQFVDTYKAAWEAGDGNAVLEHFAPNGVIVPRFGGELKGDAIKQLATLAGPGERSIELIGDPIIVETTGNGATADRRYLVAQRERFTVGGTTYEGIGLLWLVQQNGKLSIEKHQDISVAQP